ncbi:MAG: hypothetical protein IKG56_02405 [Clostridia bacterium]|nr:hypothetical protein [Clostridia bacterium]
MNKKRKSTILIASAIAVSVIGISGFVFAKYISNITGTGSLRIANWSFLVNGQNKEIGTLDLGEESYDAKTISNGLIAPGTSGSFDININANGTETGVDYYTEFKDIVNKPENLYFIVDGVQCKTIEETESALSGHFDADETDKTIVKTVEWAWDYETDWNDKTTDENDEKDTDDSAKADDFSFNVLVKGVQTQPEK